jgi:hypothetical protein
VPPHLPSHEPCTFQICRSTAASIRGAPSPESRQTGCARCSL